MTSPASTKLHEIATGELLRLNPLLMLEHTIATKATAEVDGTSAVLTRAIEGADQKRYPRPNGEDYLPRTLMVGTTKVQDIGFIRTAYAAKMPVLLYGDPGTGKTALIEAALPDLLTVQGTFETEVSDFIGSWAQQPDGTYHWVDAPLVVAAEKGLPLLIDEIAIIDPRVMTVVYGAMDGRNEIVVTANPDRGVVKIKEGFTVFGACNPDVPGAMMSDALLSRFRIHLEMDTDWSLAKKLGISANVIQVSRNLNLKKDSGQITAAPQLREMLAFKEVEEIFGSTIAGQNFIGQARPEDRETFIEAMAAVFGTKWSHFALK